jgi:hypothetical protein
MRNARSVLRRFLDVCFWHLADNATVPTFVRYWNNSGLWPALAPNELVANDPKRACTRADDGTNTLALAG